MDYGRRKVLSYSDSYAAPSGDVDLDAPLPSLAAPSPQPLAPRRPLANRPSTAAQPSYRPPPPNLLSAPVTRPWYTGPPPPFFAPPPPAVAPPLGYYGGPQPLPMHQFSGSLNTAHSQGPLLPSTAGPFQHGYPSLNHPGPYQTAHSFDRRPMAVPPRSPPTTSTHTPSLRCKIWPIDSFTFSASVVIEDCDESSDDDHSSHDGNEEDRSSDEDAEARRTSLARLIRSRTTREVVALRKRMNAYEEAAVPAGINRNKSPFMASADTTTAIPSVGTGTEYDQKQAEIRAMMEKIRQLEEAAKQRKLANVSVTSTTNETESTMATADAGAQLQFDGVDRPSTVASSDAASRDQGSSVADTLAEQRARLLESMKRGKKRKLLQTEESAVGAHEEDVGLLTPDTPAREIGAPDEAASTGLLQSKVLSPPTPGVTETQDLIEDRGVSADSTTTTAKSSKRQRKKERRRQEKEAEEDLAQLAGGG